MSFMRFKLLPALIVLSATAFLAGCDRTTQEGDLKFIAYRFGPQDSAYASIDARNYMGDGYAASFNAAPHLKIHGSWCELTWTENKPDGSKQAKSVCFPTSNIHSFKWKE